MQCQGKTRGRDQFILHPLTNIPADLRLQASLPVQHVAMAPRQGTFTLVPNPMGVQGLVSCPDAGVMTRPPMTSKQAKKLYQQSTRGPRLTKAEQRRLELAEQERIRKELDKDKQANKARIAREKKKAKEEQVMNDRRKKGLPLVDVRPSQGTLSSFLRGNGFGKKRNSEGAKVMSATSKCGDQLATDCEKENQPPHKRPRTSQRTSQREIEENGLRGGLDDIPELLSSPLPVPEPEGASVEQPEEPPEVERICDTPPSRSQARHAVGRGRYIRSAATQSNEPSITKVTQRSRPSSRDDNQESQPGKQIKQSSTQLSVYVTNPTISKPIGLPKTLPVDAPSPRRSPFTTNLVTSNQQRSIGLQPPAGTIIDNAGEKGKPKISQRIPTEDIRPEKQRDITPKPQIGRNAGRVCQQTQHAPRTTPGGLPTPEPSSQLPSVSSRLGVQPRIKPQQLAKPTAEIPIHQTLVPPPKPSAVIKAPLKTLAITTSARPPIAQGSALLPPICRPSHPPILRHSPAASPVFKPTSVITSTNAISKSAGPKTIYQTPKFLPKHTKMANTGFSTPQYRVTRNGRPQELSTEPPTSTQLFLAAHIDDVLPTPSQEARELLEGIEEVPAVRKPPFKRPSVPLFNKPPAPKPVFRPVQSTPLRPEQKQELDEILPFISTQDLILSSQDIRDVEQGTGTPSRPTEPCETVRAASLTERQLNSSFPPSATRRWAPPKPMQRGKGSELGPPPFKRPHSSGSVQGQSSGKSPGQGSRKSLGQSSGRGIPTAIASRTFAPGHLSQTSMSSSRNISQDSIWSSGDAAETSMRDPGKVSQDSIRSSGNAIQTSMRALGGVSQNSMRSSGNVSQASMHSPCDISLPAIAAPEANTSPRASPPRFFTSSGLGPEYLFALDRSKKTFEEEERRRKELQEEEQRQEELLREEHGRETQREGRRQPEPREPARSGRMQTPAGSLTNQQSQPRTTKCATELSKLVEANRSKFELAPSQETDYGDFDAEAFDLLEGILVRNNEA